MVSKLGIERGQFKYLSLLLVRGVLGMLYMYSSGLFRRAFSRYFRGRQEASLAACWTAISVTQFHLNFYSSRTLPNTFALILVLIAYHFWFLRQYYHSITIFVFATVVFRSEIILLFAPIGIELALRLPFFKLFLTGAISGVISLALTVTFDSYFWQRWLYPEGEVFYFNTILNKSHEWGTLPYYWYFALAIPKALMGACALIPVGLYYEHRKLRQVVFPVLAFLLLYSFLPHKELRFIFYVFPILNMIAALGLQHIWLQRRRLWPLLFIVLSLLTLSGFASLALGYISSQNYPGAKAIDRIHQIADRSATPLLVHLDVAACQTGFSRFLEYHPHVKYFKSENLIDFDKFTHRVTDHILHNDGWREIGHVLGFGSMRFSSSPTFPFVSPAWQSSYLFIYERHSGD